MSLALLGLPSATQATPGTTDQPSVAGSPSWKIIKPNNTGIPGNYVYSLAIDSKDRPWVTADDPIWDEGGLGQLNGRWHQWTNVDGKAPTHDMGDLTFDADGKAWMSSRVGLLTLDRGRVRTVWSKHNAPWPTSIVRDFGWDSHGNLWVALGDLATARGGVARYDGTRWKVWTTANGLPWKAPWDQVTALEIDAQDRVWIGSPVMGGALYDGTKWRALGKGSGTWVQDIAIAPNGTPWYAFEGQGIATWNGTAWVDRTGDFGYQDVSRVSIDHNGRVWIATYDGRILRWSGSGSTWDLSYDVPSLGSHVYALEFDSHNQPYVGGIGGMDVRHNDGTWTVYNVQNTALPSRWVDQIMVDDAGRGWFSTSGGGVGVYDGKRWQDFNPFNWGSAPWPFPTDSSTAAVQAPDGTVWVSPTNNGVAQWDGHTWKKYLPAQSIGSLAVDPSGDVWAAPDRGEIQRWDGSNWVGMNNPSPTSDLYGIVADPAGTIWVAAVFGLLKYDGKNWTTYTPDNSGLPSANVFSVAADPAGGVVWAGTAEGLARFDGATWTVYTEADGLPADVINSIALAPNGHVWIGAFDGQTAPYHGGVGDFDGTTWTSYTTANSPLQHNQVESVAVGADGRVWIASASQGAAILTP